MKYRYRTDEEMKDSGIEWIGKIPKDWDISKWGYVTKILTDYTANGSFGDLAKNVKYLDYKEYARLVRLVDLRDNLNNQGIYVTKKAYDYLSKSSLYGDEFLIANVGANSGFVCKMPKVNYPCTLAPNMMMARFYEDKVDNDFMIYSANSSSIKTQLLAKATQSSAQPKLNKDDFRTTKFARPSLEMQRLIVQFLDEKISQFDSIISKKESLIEKLEEAKKSLISEVVTGKVKVAKSEKGYDVVPRSSEEMKDSGVEWLGLVPKEWDITKLKMLVKSIGRGKSPDYVEDSNVRVLNQACIYWEFLNLDNVKFQNEEINYSRARLERGDLLINSTGTGTLGRANIFNEEGEFIADSHVTVVSCKDKNYSKYLRYVIRTDLYQNLIYSTMVTGSTNQIELSRDGLRNMLVLKMSNEELILIIKYLEYRIKQVEIVLYRTIKQIQKLKEAKQSLITEAVTGKIKILD